MTTARLLAAAVLFAVAPAHAQSLFVLEPASAIEDEEVDPAASLYGVSMLVVKPPEPRTYRIHDQITIVIDESSKQEAEQSLTTDKKYNIDAKLSEFPSLRHLLEMQLIAGDTPDVGVGLNHKQAFDGKGSFERTDRFTDKITATVIDVKPNGTLVLEARRHIEKGEELQTVVLSGVCRQEDVTRNNTVFSSQLADLHLVSRHEGEVDKASKKGVIPRVLEALFAF